MNADWTRISNPAIDRLPDVAVRDPALVMDGGVLRCFHTAVETHGSRYRLFLDVIDTRDLVEWAAPRRLTGSTMNYSSPGNVLRVGERWVLCVQSYPMGPGERYGNATCRLWLMESDDLVEWSAPRMINPEGCSAGWTDSARQIDPYLVYHAGAFWCFYKTSGCLGLLTSQDLETWEEASPSRPVLGPDDTPDGVGIENPCVVRDGDSYVLFFAPCRAGRGIGVARSDDLLNWRDVHYLDFPDLAWATNGPTAAVVLDTREELGHWLMAFHGEYVGRPHAAAMGLAWSDDLENWACP